MICHNNILAMIVKKFRYQKDFAAAIRRDASTVSRVLAGKRLLSANEARLWAAHLECDLDELEPVTEKVVAYTDMPPRFGLWERFWLWFLGR